MKFAKGFIFGILGILTIAFVVGLTTEPKWKVTVSNNIVLQDKIIFPYLNSLKRWSEWTVWNKQTYPEMKISYGGPESGVGAIQRWQEGDSEGTLEIIQSDPNQLLKYHLTMDNKEYSMDGEFTLSPAKHGTIVNWNLSGDSGSSIISKLIMLAYKPMIEKDLIGSLQNLKQLVESKEGSQ
jgi:hypothetical protein